MALRRPPIVSLQTLEVGDRVTQKISLRIIKEDTLVDLAVQLRAVAVEDGNLEAAKTWATTIWTPHISLLYADTRLGDNERLEAEKLVRENGIRFHDQEGCSEASPLVWRGSRILWVDTRGDIENWKILGERDLVILED